MPEGQVLLLFGIFIFLEIKSLKGNICRNFLDGKYIFVQRQMEVGNGFWLKVFYLVGIYIFNLCLKNENKVANAKACYIEFSKIFILVWNVTNSFIFHGITIESSTLCKRQIYQQQNLGWFITVSQLIFNRISNLCSNADIMQILN